MLLSKASHRLASMPGRSPWSVKTAAVENRAERLPTSSGSFFFLLLDMLLPASSGSSGVGTSTNIFREGIHSSSRKNSNVTLTGEVERRSSHDRPNAPRLRVGGSSGLHVDCGFLR